MFSESYKKRLQCFECGYSFEVEDDIYNFDVRHWILKKARIPGSYYFEDEERTTRFLCRHCHDAHLIPNSKITIHSENDMIHSTGELL